MPDGRGGNRFSRGSTEGLLSKWNAELLEENKSLKDKLSNAGIQVLARKDGPKTLQECEAIIDLGMKTHREAWFALKKIHDERLYAPKYDTFKDYCMERWGYVREGYRYLEAANVCAVLQSNDNVVTLPPSSAHARALAPLLDQPEKLHEAWDLACQLNDGRPSFLEVRDVVQGFLPKPLSDGGSGHGTTGEPLTAVPQGTIPSAREAAHETPLPPDSHLSVHLSLDAAIEEAFKKAEAGDDQIIEDLKYAAYNISRKLKELGYEPFDWHLEEPT